MIDQRAALVQKDAKAEIDAVRADLVAQVSGARGDIRILSSRVDARTGEALEIVRSTASELAAQTGHARTDADRQLTTANESLGMVARSTAALEARYTGLPDEIRADHEYQGLVAETMGVLGATKVTMGQAARTAKVVADESPKMTGHVEKIAEDVTREADALTQPKSFWASVRMWVLTIARIYGAI